MAPKTLAVAILSGQKRKRRRSANGTVRSAASAALRKQRARRNKETKRNKALFASICGIPVIGDLILAYSSPRDTPDVVYAVTNSQRLLTTVDWMRSRIIIRTIFNDGTIVDTQVKEIDGTAHSPTDDDQDAALCYVDGWKAWMKWGVLMRYHYTSNCLIRPRILP